MKAGMIAAVMGVDRADAAVAIDVVAAEQQIAQAERKLAVGVARRVPDFQLQARRRVITSPSSTSVSSFTGGMSR